jgi:AraC-like DNA-binding protein
MQFYYLFPTGILSRYIKYYWAMESDPSEADVVERVIPTANVQLMFHYGEPFLVKSPDNAITPQPVSFISGISNSYCDVSTHGKTGVIAVTFKASGACHFFEFPLFEIEDRSIDLADIYNREIRVVEDKISAKGSLQERVAVIEKFLLERYSPVPSYDYKLICDGIGIIKQSGGQVTVHGLADTLSLTSKTLERKFAAYLGKTPKQLIRLARFHNALICMERERNINLTDLACRSGYYDQSHFIRDFKMHSGYTPGEFLSLPPCGNYETDFSM